MKTWRSAKIRISDDYALDCRCGSPLCRAKLSGEDWKLPELQQRYQGYFSLYIHNKIERGMNR